MFFFLIEKILPFITSAKKMWITWGIVKSGGARSGTCLICYGHDDKLKSADILLKVIAQWWHLILIITTPFKKFYYLNKKIFFTNLELFEDS